MRQAVAAQASTPHCELGEHGLRQILTDVIAEVRQSVQQDIDGAELLHSLLNSPWLQSLLKVYECLKAFLKESPAPVVDCASGLSFQLLIDIRSLPGCSEEAKELYRLLQQPHLQALLSVHDTVAQKEYDPVLPPMPDDIPDDEEATRIVCLVKNKQPLLFDHQRVRLSPPSSSSSCEKRSGGAVQSHWDTLTRQKLNKSVAFRIDSQSLDISEQTWNRVRRGSYPFNNPSPYGEAQPYTLRRYKPMNKCTTCCNNPTERCRVCYANSIWDQNVNHSVRADYNSVMIDNTMEELGSRDEDTLEASTHVPSPSFCTLQTPQRWTVPPSCLTMSYYTNVDEYLQPHVTPRLQTQSPQIHTDLPSPEQPRQVLEVPRVGPVELAKQESLDELRSTVQLAASSMESSTKDMMLLGERMAAATQLMSETVEDNSQALVLLTQVVDKLQMLLAATRSETKIEKDAPTGEGTPLSSKSRGQRPSLTHQSRCDFPSLDPSSSSYGSQDAPSTSQETSCLSVSCHGSPRSGLKIKNATSS